MDLLWHHLHSTHPWGANSLSIIAPLSWILRPQYTIYSHYWWSAKVWSAELTKLGQPILYKKNMLFYKKSKIHLSKMAPLLFPQHTPLMPICVISNIIIYTLQNCKSGTVDFIKTLTQIKPRFNKMIIFRVNLLPPSESQSSNHLKDEPTKSYLTKKDYVL